MSKILKDKFKCPDCGNKKVTLQKHGKPLCKRCGKLLMGDLIVKQPKEVQNGRS